MEGHLAFSLSNDDLKKENYKNLLYKIYKMINEVKKLGIDTSKYELKLKTIEDEVNQSGFTSNHKKRLEDLEKVLNVYAFYQEALYNCRYVSLKISKDNTLEEIKYYANLVIIALMNISQKEVINDKIADSLILEIYEIAYNVLKMEIIITGKSDIYDYVIKNNNGLYYFDSFIEEDIMKINSHNASDLQSMIYDIKRKGLNTSYFNLDFIKLLLLHTDKNYVDKLVSNINSLFDKICNNNDILVSNQQEIDSLDEGGHTHFDNMSEAWKNVKKRIISFLLVGSVTFGWGYLTVRFIKNNSLAHLYNKQVLEYVSSDDKVYEYEEEVSFSDKEDASDYIEVTIYEPWQYSQVDNDYIRYVKTYRLEDITFDSIYDLFTYDLSMLGDEVNSVMYQYDENEAVLYQNEYRVIEQVKYTDLEETTIYKGRRGFCIFLAIFVHTFIDILGGVLFYSMREAFGRRGEFFTSTIEEIIDSIKKARSEKKLMYKDFSLAASKIKEMLDIIRENDELRLEFEKQFEKNKELIHNPDELMKKIDSINYEDIKEKVRVLAKERKIKE